MFKKIPTTRPRATRILNFEESKGKLDKAYEMANTKYIEKNVKEYEKAN